MFIIIKASLYFLLFLGCHHIGFKNNSGSSSINSIDIGYIYLTNIQDQTKKDSLDKECDRCIEIVKTTKKQADSLKSQMIKDFLCCYNETCTTNIELSEFYNDVFFLVLSKSPNLVIRELDENKNISINVILNIVENPISDKIDLMSIYKKVKEVKENKNTRDRLLNSLNISIKKLNR